MNLGSVVIGGSQSQMLTISNSGGSAVSISAAALTGSGFSVSGALFPYSLGVGQSLSLAVTFAPTVAGTNSATLGVSSNASDPAVAVSLTGTGTNPATTGTLAITPVSLNFGKVNVGSSQSQNGSITASGGSVTVSSTSSSNAQFALGGLTLPVTIAAGQNLPFSVTFAPTAPGTASATISVFTASGSAAASATGVGATLQHSVALSWNPSPTTSVSGYNVYRATSAAGPYSKINPSLNASLYFSDGTVQSGQTYYYATTAVDATGIESPYSNQVQAIVPMP